MHFIHIPKTGGTSAKQVLINAQDRRWQGHYPAWAVNLPKEELWAVVRNPYDRAISMFCNFCEDTPTTDKLKRWYSSGQNKLLMRNPDMFMMDSQSRYIYPDNELLVGTVIKFEQLEQKIKYIFGVQLPHKNISKGRSATDNYYDDELRNIIYNKYQADFRNFGYDK